MKLRVGWMAALLLALTMVCGGSAAPLAQDAPVYGQQLMTEQERTEYRARMRAAQTEQEREQIRQEHHAQMQERASQQGIKLPDEPPPMGQGMGMGQGQGMGMGQGQGMGMGGGRGGGGGAGRRGN
jgi:hypothetical protein